MVLLSVDFSNLHTILESLYQEMMPLCGDMMAVGKGLAGLGALFYVAVRVWQSLARAEPVDVYPLLRPFAIGICIMLFPTLVLGTMNTVLSPIVQGVTRNFAASLFRNIKYFTLRKLYLCRKWMQKRLQKTITTGITLPNFDFLA